MGLGRKVEPPHENQKRVLVISNIHSYRNMQRLFSQVCYWLQTQLTFANNTEELKELWQPWATLGGWFHFPPQPLTCTALLPASAEEPRSQDLQPGHLLGETRKYSPPCHQPKSGLLYLGHQRWILLHRMSSDLGLCPLNASVAIPSST